MRKENAKRQDSVSNEMDSSPRELEDYPIVMPSRYQENSEDSDNKENMSE